MAVMKELLLAVASIKKSCDSKRGIQHVGVVCSSRAAAVSDTSFDLQVCANVLLFHLALIDNPRMLLTLC